MGEPVISREMERRALIGFAKNIRRAAVSGAGGDARKAYIDAIRRAEAIRPLNSVERRMLAATKAHEGEK